MPSIRVSRRKVALHSLQPDLHSLRSQISKTLVFVDDSALLDVYEETLRTTTTRSCCCLLLLPVPKAKRTRPVLRGG
jgi:hypothetical protein